MIVFIGDLKQSGRQRQGGLRFKNKFLPLATISKMAACVYRLIRRHTLTSAERIKEALSSKWKLK